MLQSKSRTRTGQRHHKNRQSVGHDRPLRFESLEPRRLLAALPTTSLSVPSQGLLGESLTVDIGFSNNSPTDTGYGPYIDVLLPTTGTDGAGVEIDDGITFSGATYLGQPVTATVLTFDALGNAIHPLARDNSGNPLVITGTPGDQLVVLQLPFGSYTPGQPAANIEVAVDMSPLADANVPLLIQARGGFRFGNDPLDNPTSDPTLVEPSYHSDSIEPIVYVLQKTYSGPESETATGPNFERQYTVTANLAAGVTLTLLELTDTLPDNIQFVSVDATRIHGSSVAADAISTPSTSTPGGTLTRRFASVTGTNAANDVEMTFTFFVPQTDASNSDVLNPATGDDTISPNDAASTGQWTPTDLRDPPTVVSVDAPGFEFVHTNKSIAIQKSSTLASDVGATGPSPGDTIEYTLQFQVSDYFSFGDLSITDVFSDGQRFDAGFTPTFSITDRNGSFVGTFDTTGPPADLTIDLSQIGNDTNPATNGSTALQFDVSQALLNAGAVNGILQGGRSITPDAVAATGTITFRTIIQEQFSDSYLPNTPNVSEGDVLNNDVTIDGSIRDNNNLAAALGSEADTSSESVIVVIGTLSKQVYAVNGNTSLSSPIRVAPGDEVTYRFTYELPMTDFDGLSLVDYLPLPIFDATTLVSFDSTASATPPTPGVLQAGPGDTFHARTGLAPALTNSSTSNSFTITYAAFDDPSSSPSTLDLLATFVVSADPFADELVLTNQLRADQHTTNSADLIVDTLVQLTLTEPDLDIAKGVVATDNPAGVFTPTTVGPVAFSAPGSSNPRFSGTINSTNLATTPIDSNLADIDAGDLVTFAIVIENTGTGLNGAFDVQVRDTLPPGFAIPGTGLNLSITDGTGVPLTYTDLGGGLLGGGIELTDGAGIGSLAPRDTTSGHNILIITYDLEAETFVEAAATLENTTSLFNFAGLEGGTDHTTTDQTDTATVQITSPVVSKSTPDTVAVIGQTVTYEIVVTVPEGETPSAQVVDTLDSGLAFVGLTSVTTSDAADVSWTAIVPAVTNNGQTIAFDMGLITNTDRVNNTAETITITYEAVVLNVLGNQQGTTLDNSAVLSWSRGSLPSASAAPITVIEPSITTTKSVMIGAGGTTGDAGDAVQYTIALRNNSSVDAFDATLSDALPRHAAASSLIIAPILGVTDSAGTVLTSDFELVGDDVNGWTLQTVAGFTFDMPADPARVITITVAGTLAQAVQPDETITNTAETRFTSINGNPGTISTYNTNSTERTGTSGVGGGLNNYATAGTTDLDIYDPTPVKSLVSSSETSTSGNNVAIGEIARFRLVSRLAEGTAPDFEMIDQLPSGLRMLDDGTATLAVVANDGGIVSSTLAGVGLAIVGNETTVASITPTFPLPGSAITGAPFTSGTDPVFQLGTLINTDNDADLEYVVIEFNALVENTAGNQAGVTLNDTAHALVDGSIAGINSNIVAISVVEPTISNLSKTANPTIGDSGDTISYRVTFSNPATVNVTTAFNVQLSDTLPSDLMLDLASISITATAATGVIDNSFGNTISVDIAALAPGGSIQIDYDAVLQGSVQPEELVNNTASLIYTSLPGAGTSPNPTGSTTPGPDGSITGQRNGSGGVNNYSATDGATVAVTEPEFTKILLSTNQSSTSGNDVLVGEQVEYELSFSVVEGTTTGVSVADQFPTGMALVSLDTISASPTLITSVAGGFTGALNAASISADGTDFTIVLDTVTNSDTNNATTEGVVITFTAIVLNHATVQDGVDLVNSATVAYSSGDVTTTAPAVGVVEPDLEVDKSPSSPTGDAGGAAITYTIVIAHSPASTADAFEVALADSLPVGLDFVAGSLAHVGGVVPSALAESSGTITATFNTLLLGDTSTLEFAAVLNGSTLPGQTISNTATVRHTSLPGDQTTPMSTYNNVATERTGDTRDPGGSINNYRTSNSGPVTVRSNSLAGFVYTDHDNDGVRETGETGVGGVPLTLIGTDNLGNAVNLTTNTAPDGSYSFPDLRPGSYRIEAAQPSGMLDGKDTAGSQGGTVTNDRIDVVLPVNTETDGTENNFGELLPASVSGIVYRDDNNNGTQQAGETGVNGVALRLTGTDDRGAAVDVSATTNSSGAFNIGDLRPGTYTLTEAQPSGLLDGKDTIGTQGGTLGNDLISDFTLSAGANGTGNLFGELEPASLAGVVYEDVNDNGAINSGEAGIGNVTIVLTGTDDLGNSVSSNTTTAADGTYSFAGLRPGSYQLAETQPVSPFYFDGIDTIGSLGGVVSNDQFGSIAVLAGEAGADYLFGELPPADPVGYVFVDVNDNGIREAGEPGIPGVLITVTGTDDLGQPVTLTDTTDANGFYQFQYLRPGTYRIDETQPAGYVDGQEQNGSPPATVAPDSFQDLALTWGQIAGDYNFGEIAYGSLSGQVYVDSNLNGQPDLVEMPLAGVTITLLGQDLVGNAINQTTTTDAAGNYAFNNLVPGTYHLEETQPASYLDGRDRVGSLGGTLQPDAVDQIFLAANEDGTDYDFGENGLLPELITKQFFLARNRRLI